MAMRILAVPGRLRAALFALAGMVPLAALETFLLAHLRGWSLPYYRLVAWSLVAAAFWGLFSLAIGTLGRSGLIGCAVAAAAWIAFTVDQATEVRHAAFWAFAILLIAYFCALGAWVISELRRPWLNSGVRWYEGLPRALPVVECTVVMPEIQKGSERAPQAWRGRVSRIGPEGVFVFSKSEPLPGLRRGQEVRIELAFRGDTLKCQGIPVAVMNQDMGAGFLFSLKEDGRLAGDRAKEIGDFFERLRGEGYV